MPSNEQSFRPQKAVIWLALAADSYGNLKVSTTPQEIDVRWESSRRQSYDTKGEPVSISGELHTETKYPIGSTLWKGCLKDLPNPLSNIHRIVGYDETPDIKGREVEVITLVSRFGNSLPPQ